MVILAKTYMDTTDSYLLSRARTQYQRIAETIGGKVIEGNAHGYFIQGKIMVATANPDKMKEYVEKMIWSSWVIVKKTICRRLSRM